MITEKYKIVGLIDNKKITFLTVYDEASAERERTRFAKSLSSSWTVKIELSTEVK